MDRLEPNRLIPPELVIKDYDDLLYEIGLCRTSVRERPKRWPINNPKFITIMSLMSFVKSLVTLLVPESDPQIFGDIGRYLSISVQWNLIFNLGQQIVITNKLNYYYNHRKGFEPTFLRVFQMMSGSVAPLSVGLTDNRDIRRLLKHKPIFQFLIIQIRYLNFITTSFFIMSSFILYEDLSTVVTYGVLHTLLYSISSHHFEVQIFSQLFYCYMICVYLKSKIRNLNKNLIGFAETKSGIKRILNKLDSIYAEIDDYNTTYWSKFLFINWLYLGSLSTITLFMVLFISLPLLLKTVLTYSTLFIGSLLHFMYATASSLNTEANRSYRPFNAIMTKRLTDTRLTRMARFKQKLKVSQLRQSLLMINKFPNKLP